MPLNFNNPVTSQDRAAVLASIREAQIALARMLDGETLTGTPTNAIRYSSANEQFEKFNGTSWTELPQKFLKLTGGTLTGALSGTSAAFNSLTVGGSAVWHAGNFSPFLYQLALGFTPVRQGGGSGQLGNTVYIGWSVGGLKAQVDSTDLGNLWYSGNFNPASKQDASTAWNTSNFNPGSYAPLSGATFSGSVNGTFFGAANVRATGAGAFLGFEQRDAIGSVWGWYATGGTARLWNGVADAFTVSLGGNVTMSNDLQLRGGSPTITLRDTDASSGFIHVNGNILYILRGNNDTGAGNWSQVDGQWPLQINLSNNDMTVGRNIVAVGNVTAFSDARLKTNIESYDLTVDQILKMPLRQFDMTHGRSAGVIAQDVDAVAPLFVTHAAYLSVDYGRLAFAMVASLTRELRTRGVV